MKSQFLFATLAATVLAVPLAAQAPQTPAPQTPTTPSATAPQRSASDRTITGCVAAGTDARTFTLTESSAASATTPSQPSTDPAAAAGAVSSSATWTLIGKSDVDLSRYVGKKVEITGTSDAKAGTSPDRYPSTTRSDASMAGPRFNVKSVRVIADTCS